MKRIFFVLGCGVLMAVCWDDERMRLNRCNKNDESAKNHQNPLRETWFCH